MKGLPGIVATEALLLAMASTFDSDAILSECEHCTSAASLIVLPWQELDVYPPNVVLLATIEQDGVPMQAAATMSYELGELHSSIVKLLLHEPAGAP